MKQITGQMSIFDIQTEPQKKNRVDSCDGCDVQFGSIACFRKLGYTWDPVNRFAKDAEGNQIRRSLENRECKRVF